MDNFIIKINTLGNNENGYLSFFESNKDIDFEIKRIYYIHGVPNGSKRGMHAHKELQQLLWCPIGSVEVILDNGNETQTFLLDTPQKGLLVLKGYWHDMYWKEENSVLSVAASDFYDENDYIRDYKEFHAYVEKGFWDNEG
ncbi:sugar 3,4-ketoisomerase [Planomicrobium okeanokoites]|uniref:sugar 3,4-ketoisomerase n=1 Tax=Planomicrobium okeanokoites TaxID=244 RepID=UPI001C4E082D|nr:FdtA/QdtA family cupin domain-containing protein [Planomicrobium okeanokoites]